MHTLVYYNYNYKFLTSKYAKSFYMTKKFVPKFSMDFNTVEKVSRQ